MGHFKIVAFHRRNRIVSKLMELMTRHLNGRRGGHSTMSNMRQRVSSMLFVTSPRATSALVGCHCDEIDDPKSRF